MLEWYTGTVINIIEETYNTRRFFIQAPQPDAFSFIPGQFVTLDLPIHEKKNKRWRSYSIASPPDETNIFELLIVLVEDGSGTNYLFKEIKVGDTLTYRGPLGVFTLPENLTHDLIFVCTGTGIAPFRSMLQFVYRHSIHIPHIYLIYGTRTKADLLYYNELSELQLHMPNFTYLPTLSREHWHGHKGYVHPLYTELIQKNPSSHIMLCGWKNMIDEARHILHDLEVDKTRIHFELYG